MAKKVEITFTFSQADFLKSSLQLVPKQTKTVAALYDEVVNSVNIALNNDAKKVTLALPASKAEALAKALAAVPKQTKTVEKLNSIVVTAISAYDQVLADDSANV